MICFLSTISFASVLLSIAVQAVKKCFRTPIPKKIGTSWDLNPYCSGGRSHHHITHINPFAKYPKFGGVTASSRGGMTGKVLTRQLNRKTWIGWELNTRPLEYRKSYTTLSAIMLTPSTPSFMSLLPSIASPIQEKYWNIPWKTLRPGWIWTHARRIT